MRKLFPLALILILVLTLIPPAAAQDSAPERVEVTADDGLTLVGLYDAPPEEAIGESGAPAVLLMHHSGSQKEVWIDFIPLLHDAGYAALTVDLRGHGETGGTLEAEPGIADIHTWLAWLRAQPGVDPARVSIVGASTGADLGLQAMAEDEQLVTLVGISVLLENLDRETAPAVEAIGSRPLYLIAGQQAQDEADAARELLQVAKGEIQIQLYDSPACCTFLLMLEDDLAGSIIAWLDDHVKKSTPPNAADVTLPEAQRVEVTASDGLALVGDFYAAPESTDSGAPAVLLLHMLASSRGAWWPLVPPLHDAGYAILAVDLRGHGETGSRQNWPLAEQDVQTWLDWLRDQPGVDPARVSIVGASIGSNLALRGMANDAQVVTAVALSPGLDYYNVTTDDALATIGDRPVFLVSAQLDAPSNFSTKKLATLAGGDMLVHLYQHRSHGTSIFSLEADLAPAIVNWLDVHH